MQLGVPGMGLNVDGTKYFWYHHTDADTIDKLDPHDLALCVATMAIMAYVVADLPDRLLSFEYMRKGGVTIAEYVRRARHIARAPLTDAEFAAWRASAAVA